MNAQAVLINFEEQPAGTAISDQFLTKRLSISSARNPL